MNEMTQSREAIHSHEGSQSPGTPPDAAVATLDVCRAVVLGGRGRVGKTTVANAIVQFCRSRGAVLEVWNADRQNETHSLSLFHDDALRPGSDDPEDKRLWLEAGYDRQARLRFDSVLDVAGGDPLVRQLAKGARLVSTLSRRQVRMTSLQVLGPDIADLDYLRLSMDGGLFMPEATVLVLNSGLVRSGRAVRDSFSEVVNSPVYMDAVQQGAMPVWFPNLLCMGAVSDRGLTFSEALSGVLKPGQEPLSFFDQARVEIFWEEELPACMARISPDWLPAMPGWER